MKKLIFLMSILILCCNSNKEELYQKSELQNLTLTELRIKRNEIFAKHGYIFNSQDLSDYFSQYDWYNPTNKNVDSLLSEIDRANINLIAQIESNNKSFLIDVDPNLISNYKSLENSSNKDFIDKLIKTISKFKDQKADTTIFQICNIDNIGRLDTIINRIYFSNDVVIVNSSWTKDGQKLWEYEITNPYLWIDDSDEFQYDTREPWVTFTIGIFYAIPDIYSIDIYSHIDKQMIMQIGLEWAKSKNLKMSKDEYSYYLDSFRGDIIAHGDPEIRHELLIWYEPVKDFVLFYAP